MLSEAKELREQRELAGMTQVRAAREVGIDRSALSLFESGDIELKPETLAKLRHVYARELRQRRDELDALLTRVSPQPEAPAMVGA